MIPLVSKRDREMESGRFPGILGGSAALSEQMGGRGILRQLLVFGFPNGTARVSIG